MGSPIYGFGSIIKGENIRDQRALYLKRKKERLARVARVAIEQPDVGAEDEEAPEITDDRLRLFTRALSKVTNTDTFSNDRASVDDIVPAINGQIRQINSGATRFQREESILALRQLSDENRIMYLSEGEEVYTISGKRRGALADEYKYIRNWKYNIYIMVG